MCTVVCGESLLVKDDEACLRSFSPLIDFCSARRYTSFLSYTFFIVGGGDVDCVFRGGTESWHACGASPPPPLSLSLSTLFCAFLSSLYFSSKLGTWFFYTL